MASRYLAKTISWNAYEFCIIITAGPYNSVKSCIWLTQNATANQETTALGSTLQCIGVILSLYPRVQK